MSVVFIQLLRYGLRTARGTHDVQSVSLGCAFATRTRLNKIIMIYFPRLRNIVIGQPRYCAARFRGDGGQGEGDYGYVVVGDYKPPVSQYSN